MLVALLRGHPSAGKLRKPFLIFPRFSPGLLRSIGTPFAVKWIRGGSMSAGGPCRFVRGVLALFVALGLMAGAGVSASASPTGEVVEPGNSGAADVAALDPPQWRIREAIAERAIGQIGQRETGVNNYPKRYQDIDKKNVVRPAEWCGVFVNWAWASAGVPQRPRMKAPRGAPAIDQGHWATYWQKWGKANGRWKAIGKRDVSKGDAVVYGNYPAEIAHVGVVVDVKRDPKTLKVTHVRTVEGNVGNKVTDLKWRKITALTGRGVKASGFVSPF
ncbi:CHAP domain-containing protein [Actinosynnema sp. CS-041913]|uniref:CHAP domain-containing protein n=1 Tax=Actinosynnema sp. CS-041913 TaxID=3239917 RepID=UPI003D89C923